MAPLLLGQELRELWGGQTEDGCVQCRCGPEVAGWGSDAQMWMFHSIPCGTQDFFHSFAAAINYLNTYLTFSLNWGFETSVNVFRKKSKKPQQYVPQIEHNLNKIQQNVIKILA